MDANAIISTERQVLVRIVINLLSSEITFILVIWTTFAVKRQAVFKIVHQLALVWSRN